MPNRLRFVLAASLLSVATAGCTSFLNEDKATTDPNNPTTASADQLFIGAAVAQWAQQEGFIALTACAWMQQCTGTSNFLQEIEQYNLTTEDLMSPSWSSVYVSGGLSDIRAAEAKLVGIHRGVAKIYEALDIATAADVWGDVPYRTAVTTAKPTLDPQMQVYGDLQTLLDDAITDLNSGTPTGTWTADLVFQGNAAKWIAVAHTLKARLYLHTAEVNGAAAYTAAQTQALLGITVPANNWVSKHPAPAQPGTDNMWFQFYSRSGFGQYVVAGRFLADLMNARGEATRLPQYFGPAVPGPGFGGQDPNGGRSPAGVSDLAGTRMVPTFSQPIVTWEENQMILAEVAFRQSGAAAAQPYVDALRASVTGLAPKTVTSLNDIMEEKYVALYQNPEVWNDYKRTCYPPITPFPTTKFNNHVPGRFYYGTPEENANPNIPSKSQQEINNSASTGFRNANDPNPC